MSERQPEPWSRRYHEFGQLIFDTLKTKAFVNDEDLRLTENEYDALYLLAQRTETGMTWEDLYKAVWEPPDGGDRQAVALECMTKLRERLNAFGKGDVRIRKLCGIKYKLELEKKGVDSMDMLNLQEYLNSWYISMYNIDIKTGTNKPVVLFPDDISYLLAHRAKLIGNLTYNKNDEKHPKGVWCVANWKSGSDSIMWEIDPYLNKDTYEFSAIIKGVNGASIKVETISPYASSFTYTFTTDHWDKLIIGDLLLKKSSEPIKLKLSATTIPQGASLELKSLELIPHVNKKNIYDSIAQSRSQSTWMKYSPMALWYTWGEWVSPTSNGKTTWPQCYETLLGKNFEKVTSFVKRIADMGAQTLVWPLSWATYYVAAPIKAVDAVLPGRTSNIDYLGALLDECQCRGIKVMFYYHLGHDSDSAAYADWWKAFWDVPTINNQEIHYLKAKPIKKWIDIITEIGNRYGKRLAGWYFDDGCCYYPSPFRYLSQAAKAGNPDRMIAFNPWYQPRFTEYQDFHFGEVASNANLDELSNGKYKAGPQMGLHATRNFCTEDGDWGIKRGAPLRKTTLDANGFKTIANHGHRVGQLMAYNLLMMEDGSMNTDSVTRLTNATASNLTNGMQTRTIDISFPKGYYLSWNIMTQTGRQTKITLSDDAKTYFVGESKQNAMIVPPKGNGADTIAGSNLRVTILAEIYGNDKIKLFVNDYDIKDDSGRVVGHGKNIFIEDSVDNDYNDVSITLIAWARKG